MGLLIQASPHLRNTSIMALCRAQSDREDDLVGTMAPHTEGLLAQQRHGVAVWG